MAHIWVRAEQRLHEERCGLTPEGAAKLIAAGHRVTVEESRQRIIPIADYAARGCTIVPEATWPAAPTDALIFGLKELPSDETPLPHRHIMFGHAFKGQPAGAGLLRRFQAGGGALYDLEYLTDDQGRRVAAFGYWAGFAGAAIALHCWLDQARGGIAGPVTTYDSAHHITAHFNSALARIGGDCPATLIIGALGRVGTGAADFCRSVGLPVTPWDMAETASGGPFPEILAHPIFLNCILARPGTPVFVPKSTRKFDRALRVIGDIACDPDSAFSPIKVYDRATSWDQPALRVHANPPLDIMAIDNLPSLLPAESSEDFATQLLPQLMALDDIESGVWARARACYDAAISSQTSGNTSSLA